MSEKKNENDLELRVKVNSAYIKKISRDFEHLNKQQHKMMNVLNQHTMELKKIVDYLEEILEKQPYDQRIDSTSPQINISTKSELLEQNEIESCKFEGFVETVTNQILGVILDKNIKSNGKVKLFWFPISVIIGIHPVQGTYGSFLVKKIYVVKHKMEQYQQ
jgi:hypothetical protein